MHDVFISYSHKNQIQATMVLNLLEKSEIRCWIDYRDAIPGTDYAASIVKAIKTCKFFVLILSAASSESKHVLSEINSAVNAGITIIPFKLDEIDFNDSLEYYLGKSHWLDAITPPIENHINKLVSVIKNYAELLNNNDAEGIEAKVRESVVKPLPQTGNSCRVVSFDELVKIGHTASSIAAQLVENDYINCNGIGLENEGTAQQWEEYLCNNSDTFHYFINEENKIVGDWSIVALNDESFADAMQGKLLEKDIDVDKTEMICLPGTYNGYLLTMSLLPNYRSIKNYNMLIKSFFEELEKFSDDGIYFSRWCTNVFSKDVEAIVKSLGFHYVCDNMVFGKIYSLDFKPLPNIAILKNYLRLVENYKNA